MILKIFVSKKKVFFIDSLKIINTLKKVLDNFVIVSIAISNKDDNNHQSKAQ